MKRNRQILILLALLAVTTAGGLFFALLETDASAQQVETISATEFSVGEVQGMVLKNAGGSFGLINTPAGVILQDGGDVQYSQEKLKMLIYTLSHLQAQRQIDPSGASREEFGLDAPLAQASLLLSERTVRLTLGRQNPVSEEYYLEVEGDSSLYMLDPDTAGYMLHSRDDLRDLSLYPALTSNTISSITQIQVRNDSGTFVLQPMAADRSGIYFGMTSPVETMLDWERVTSRVLNPLRELYPEKFVSDDVPLANYGLDQPDLTLEVTMDGRVYRCGFVQRDPDTWYCASLDRTLVSQLSAQQVEFLQADFMDLVGNSIYTKSVADINRISMKYSGQSFSMEITGESTELTGEGDGFQLDQNELLDFYETIDSIPAAGLLDGTEAVDPKPLLTISITLRDGGEDILEFYPISLRQCAVYINGASEFSTYTTVVEDMISAAELLRQ